MMKRIAAAAMAGATVLSLAGSAFAFDWDWQGRGDVDVENRDIDVTVVAKAESDTGDNDQYASVGGSQSLRFGWWGHHSQGDNDVDQTMRTGEAWSTAEVGLVDVATTKLSTCGCDRRGDVDVYNHDFDVTVRATAESETGENEQSTGGEEQSHHHSSRGDITQTMTTGKADSWSKVNLVSVAYTEFSLGD